MEGPPETKEKKEIFERMIGQLQQYARDAFPSSIEPLWLEAMESPDEVRAHLKEFLDVAELVLAKDPDRERAGVLLELLLSCVGPDMPARDDLRLHGLLVRALPQKAECRAAFAQRFERLYSVTTPDRAFYEASGFASSADPGAALDRLEKLSRFRVGSYVLHRAGWGIGKVIAVEPLLRQVKVDFARKKQHRIAIDVIDTILEPLEADSFLVLKQEGGAELTRLRDEDPVRLITVLFSDYEKSMPLKDIKAKLVPDVVEADAWIRWWNKARGLLRDSGRFRVGDLPPHTVEVLEKPVSYEDELLVQFRRSTWPKARQIARQVARQRGAEPSPIWSKMRLDLLKILDEAEPARAIEVALILDRGDGGPDKGALGGLYSKLSMEALIRGLEGLSGVDDQRRATERLPALRPQDWREIVLKLFQQGRDVIRGIALEVLEKEDPARASSIVAEVVRTPKMAPDAFFLLLAAFLEGKDRPVLEPLRQKSPRDLLVLVVDLFEHLQHVAPRGRRAVKGTFAKAEDLLLAQEAKIFRGGVEAMTVPEQQEVHDRIVKNESISPHAKGALLDILMEVEPGLVQSSMLQIWEENVVYVTAEGLARKQGEFRELMEVKLPKVFEDIGRAAAFGDLSENAEYTAALEERDKLTKRAASVKNDLEKAKIIDPSRCQDGIVGLGSRIRLRNERTGEEAAFRVLGPWDGGPEEGVLSYKSPLGRAFLGKGVGDVVEAQLPAGPEVYKILEAHSAQQTG
jgi:transcription elongation factor GreA